MKIEIECAEPCRYHPSVAEVIGTVIAILSKNNSEGVEISYKDCSLPDKEAENASV